MRIQQAINYLGFECSNALYVIRFDDKKNGRTDRFKVDEHGKLVVDVHKIERVIEKDLMTFKEIDKRLKMSEGTAKRLFVSAMAKLQENSHRLEIYRDEVL